MGKLAVYKYVSAMFLVAQLVITIFTIVGLFGGNVNPAGNTARAMLSSSLFPSSPSPAAYLTLVPSTSSVHRTRALTAKLD